MSHSWFYTVVVLGLFILLEIQCASALQVEFYSKVNYVGYADGVQKMPGQDLDCYTLDNRIQIKSIKTDKCLILYGKNDCTKEVKNECDADLKCDRFSFRVNNDTSQFAKYFPTYPYYPFIDSRKIWSFHVCSEERGGGPALDFDYYNDEQYSGKLLRQWTNVCTCQNIPEDMRKGHRDFVSFDNHGNDVEIFSEENCQGDKQHLLAGDNRFTRYAVENVIRFDVASFQPLGLNDCIKLNAQIQKFHFKNGTSGDPVVENVKLATSGDIINNGAAETSEQYTLTESVSQTVEFSIATGYTEMNTVGVSASATVSAEAGVPLVGEADVSASISADYQYQRGSSGSNTTTTTVTKTTTVQVVQTITVPGCHNCTADAYVRQAKDFPIDYESYSYISGYAGSTRMSAAEVKANLPAGVDYVEDVDEYTVGAVTEGTMYAQYGLQTLVDVNCDKIPSCSPKSVHKGPTTFHYESPFEATKKENWRATNQDGNEIGTSMGKNCNWNSLSDSSLAF